MLMWLSFKIGDDLNWRKGPQHFLFKFMFFIVWSPRDTCSFCCGFVCVLCFIHLTLWAARNNLKAVFDFFQDLYKSLEKRFAIVCKVITSAVKELQGLDFL